VRAAEAVALFCYQVKKWIGSFAAALGGLDTFGVCRRHRRELPVHSRPDLRGLGFLGVELNEKRNAENAAVISPDDGRATVRVIRTDEERMIAQTVCRVLGLGLTH